MPGWDRGGATPTPTCAPRGAERNYSDRQRQRRSVVILTGRPIAAFAPAGWRVVDSYGSAASRVDNPHVEFEALSPRYVVGTRAGQRRRGDVELLLRITNATCSTSVPDVPAGDRMMTSQIPRCSACCSSRVEDQELCIRYHGNAGDGYRGLAFLPDGRPLPRIIRSARADHDRAGRHRSIRWSPVSGAAGGPDAAIFGPCGAPTRCVRRFGGRSGRREPRPPPPAPTMWRGLADDPTRAPPGARGRTDAREILAETGERSRAGTGVVPISQQLLALGPAASRAQCATVDGTRRHTSSPAGRSARSRRRAGRVVDSYGEAGRPRSPAGAIPVHLC